MFAKKHIFMEKTYNEKVKEIQDFISKEGLAFRPEFQEVMRIQLEELDVEYFDSIVGKCFKNQAHGGVEYVKINSCKVEKKWDGKERISLKADKYLICGMGSHGRYQIDKNYEYTTVTRDRFSKMNEISEEEFNMSLNIFVDTINIFQDNLNKIKQ